MKRIKIIFLFLFLWPWLLPGQEMEKDFDRLVREEAGIGLSKKVSAGRFVQTYGKRAIPFLTRQATTRPDREARSAAIQLLGSIGGSSAADSLVAIAQKNRSYLSQLAILNLPQTKTEEVKPRLERMALEAGPSRIRIGAAVALRWLGDRKTATQLRQSASTASSPQLAGMLKNTSRSILFRLDSLPPGITDRQWQDYEQRFWLTHYDRPVLRNPLQAISVSVARIDPTAPLPMAFLQRFDQQEWWEAQLLAISLCARQKEPGAESYLKTFVDNNSQSSTGRVALAALAQLATPEAYRLLEKQLLWVEDAPKKYIVEHLVRQGSPEAALFLKRLSTITPDQEWATYFRDRAGAIKLRK